MRYNYSPDKCDAIGVTHNQTEESTMEFDCVTGIYRGNNRARYSFIHMRNLALIRVNHAILFERQKVKTLNEVVFFKCSFYHEDNHQ